MGTPYPIIASQLDAAANHYLRERLPGAEVIDLDLGGLALTRLPSHATVLIARPVGLGGPALEQRPGGWPGALRWVQLSSSGIDAFPRWLFDAEQVTSGKGGNANHVAEFALAAIFSAAKHLPGLWVTDDKWGLTTLQPIAGSTLGILGFGAIGQNLASKALALGMQVLALGRPEQPLTTVPGVKAARDIHHLFSHADHLVVAAPLTPQTHHLLNRDVLLAARPGLHLINLARGGLLDQHALLEALEQGAIGLATLDVTDPEPLPNGHPLYHHPKVRISPHTSAISADGQLRLVDDFLLNLQRLGQGLPLHNLVDIKRGY